MENVTGDLFATKGIEYLIVIGYLVVLIGFFRLLTRPRPVGVNVPLRPAGDVRGWSRIEDGFYFHQGHSWAKPESRDVVRVGMDAFAHRLLGRPGSIELPDVGSRLRQGERGWAVEVDSKSIPVLSPVEGQVMDINRAVLLEPAKASSDPYDRGWLMKIRVANPEANLKNLLTGQLARSWMEETLENLRAMNAGELGVVLPDGGIPIDGFVRVLAPDNWDQVARAFLLSD